MVAVHADDVRHAPSLKHDLLACDLVSCLSAGKLGLVLELVRCLDRHDLTTPAGNLVKLLIEGATPSLSLGVKRRHAPCTLFSTSRRLHQPQTQDTGAAAVRTHCVAPASA